MTKQNRELSKLAKWSLGLAIFTPFIFMFCAPALISWFLSIVFDLTAIFQIIIKRKKLKGIPFAIGGISLSVIWIFIPMLVFGTRVCPMRLGGIGVSMRIYSQEFDNKYPTSDK